MNQEVHLFLSRMEAEAKDPEGAQRWSTLETLFQAKQYHQITVILLNYVKKPEAQSADILWPLYESFIKEFELRMNPVSLMDICAVISEKIADGDAAIKFLKDIDSKLRGNIEAKAHNLVTRGRITLFKKNDIRGTKDILEEADELLKSYDGVSPVHSKFYLLESDLYSKMNNTAGYYHSALKFLGCGKMEDLSHEEQTVHAEKLIIAAIIGDGIYNFGELLAHPIINSLLRTNKHFLIDLLRAFNRGEIDEFLKLKPLWETIPILRENEELLFMKVYLLCIMEMTFKRESLERKLTFDEIIGLTKLSPEGVEDMVMKAISKGLVKGRIDQVGRKVTLTWVQPRVLDRTQIATMVGRLERWQNEIMKIEGTVSTDSAAFIAA